jgi:hypothetical protein
MQYIGAKGPGNTPESDPVRPRGPRKPRDPVANWLGWGASLGVVSLVVVVGSTLVVRLRRRMLEVAAHQAEEDREELLEGLLQAHLAGELEPGEYEKLKAKIRGDEPPPPRATKPGPQASPERGVPGSETPDT